MARVMRQLEVLYEDNHLLVVVKPAGMPVQEDETQDPDLLSLAKAYIKDRYDKPGDVFLGLVHRLDRPVSGIVVFARTSKAASRLSAQFREHTITKRYFALVEGRFEESGECVDYLHKHKREVRVVRSTHPEGKRAELTWRSLGVEGKVSLLDIDLKTGRPHQIRVQLSSRKMPIKGDVRYKAQTSFDYQNLALHAYALALDHPTKKIRMGWSVAPKGPWLDWFREIIRERVAAFRTEFAS